MSVQPRDCNTLTTMGVVQKRTNRKEIYIATNLFGRDIGRGYRGHMTQGNQGGRHILIESMDYAKRNEQF